LLLSRSYISQSENKTGLVEILLSRSYISQSENKTGLVEILLSRSYISQSENKTGLVEILLSRSYISQSENKTGLVEILKLWKHSKRIECLRTPYCSICVVCSSIYGFWLPPFSIFKLFLNNIVQSKMKVNVWQVYNITCDKFNSRKMTKLVKKEYIALNHYF
jgi:hypothetical protein